jgi:Protein of unknown function (DUF2612)
LSGPNYPHPNPKPGSNAIGFFQIGVSPIGTIPTFDPWATLLMQYANSPTLTALITSFNAAMDLTQPMESVLDLIWNIQTAQGYGLDVLGRIVGVSRTLLLPGGVTYLGFEEAGGSWTGFGQGGLFSGGTISNNFVLLDSDFRKLIYVKAASNVCDGSIPSINKILLALFPGRGIPYVADNLNNSLTYTFNFALNPVELSIISTSGVLPNPAGMIVIVSAP